MANRRKLTSQNMIRIYDKVLVDKLQEMFIMSNCDSVNEFFNMILKQVAFRENKIDVILEKVEDIEDKVNTTYLLVKDGSVLK